VAGGGAVRDRWESLAALARLADDLTAGRPDVTLRDFVAELDERADAQHAPAVDGVTLASLHAAKGLEWDAVFVVGVTDGMLPITYAATPEQVEEERRLLYVGVTRAREHLAITWSLARSPGGRPGRRPSRFLDGMHGGRTGPAAAAGASSRRRAPATCRVCGKPLTAPVARKLGRCEDCPSAYDEELFERLREWRAEQARSQSVPAYVVFTDATLTALAEMRPDSSFLALGRRFEQFEQRILPVRFIAREQAQAHGDLSFDTHADGHGLAVDVSSGHRRLHGMPDRVPIVEHHARAALELVVFHYTRLQGQTAGHNLFQERRRPRLARGGVFALEPLEQLAVQHHTVFDRFGEPRAALAGR